MAGGIADGYDQQPKGHQLRFMITEKRREPPDSRFPKIPPAALGAHGEANCGSAREERIALPSLKADKIQK